MLAQTQTLRTRYVPSWHTDTSAHLVTESNSIAQSQRTALHVAIACGATDAAIYLLENGARMDIKDEVSARPVRVCLPVLPFLTPIIVPGSGAAPRWSVHGMRRCGSCWSRTKYVHISTSVDAHASGVSRDTVRVTVGGPEGSGSYSYTGSRSSTRERTACRPTGRPSCGADANACGR